MGENNELSTFLRALGLVDLLQKFTDNGVDMSVVPSLSYRDLKELGITLLGTRRKFLMSVDSIKKKDAFTGTSNDSSQPRVRRAEMKVPKFNIEETAQ